MGGKPRQDPEPLTLQEGTRVTIAKFDKRGARIIEVGPGRFTGLSLTHEAIEKLYKHSVLHQEES